MPIEINELVIKAKIADSASNDSSHDAEDDAGSGTNQAALKEVEKAVNTALEIVNRKNER
jgi:hypothetical protein